MSRDLKFLGIALFVLGFVLVGRLVLTEALTAFEFARARILFVASTASDIGQYASSFLWTYRVLDVLAAAFLVFIAAACCVAMLREERA